MAELGHFTLLLAIFLSGYAIVIDFLGAWRKKNDLIASGRNSTIACLFCLSVAMLALWVLLLKRDFSVQYVAEHTSKTLPFAYRLSALWAGAAGSLLLWLWLQVGFVALVFCKSEGPQLKFVTGARIIANLVSVFFLLVLVFDKNPFALTVATPSDGSGLNPLLQHPAMVLHPPTLFIGYAALIIPFAWTFSILKISDLEAPYPLFEQVRNWILWAWMFLTIGIVLGAWWAYEELGWGGYWAWDPVENSSLMPWLMATALVHCSRIYKRNSSIIVWLMIISIITFSLCIFGTFLTRYGLISSVHAFPEPGLGILFLVLIIHIWAIAVALFCRFIKKRRYNVKKSTVPGLKFIVLNNWLMIVLVLVIFTGTMFPFFSGLLSSQKITLKPEYFTKITAPGGLLLLFLIGLCPYLLNFGTKLNWRTISAVISAATVLIVWIITHRFAPLCFILCGLAILNLAGDFFLRYTKNKGNRAKNFLTSPSLRWLGARMVHVGVVLAFLGIAGSGGYSKQSQAALKTGEHMAVGGYRLVFDNLDASHGPNFTTVTANLSVYRSNQEPDQDAAFITKLRPSKAYYHKSNKPTSEVDIRRTLGGDLYTAIEDVDNVRKIARVKVLIKPLINWIWIGSAISMLGTIMVLTSFYMRKPNIIETENVRV